MKTEMLLLRDVCMRCAMSVTASTRSDHIANVGMVLNAVMFDTIF